MMAEIHKKTHTIRVLTLDGDGVVFTGHAFIDQDGKEHKQRSLIDGMGVVLLRGIGIRVALVSAEKTGQLEAVGEKWNSTESCRNGLWEPVEIIAGVTGDQKVDAVDKWLRNVGASWDDCAHMGDDLSDYALLEMVGLPAAPAQAEEVIKKLVRKRQGFIAERRGGGGAIRDFADFILGARDIDPTTLPLR